MISLELLISASQLSHDRNSSHFFLSFVNFSCFESPGRVNGVACSFKKSFFAECHLLDDSLVPAKLPPTDKACRTPAEVRKRLWRRRTKEAFLNKRRRQKRPRLLASQR